MADQINKWTATSNLHLVRTVYSFFIYKPPFTPAPDLNACGLFRWTSFSTTFPPFLLGQHQSHEIVLVEPFLVAPASFPPRTHQLLVPPLPLFFLLFPLLSNDDYESASAFPSIFFFFFKSTKPKMRIEISAIESNRFPFLS